MHLLVNDPDPRARGVSRGAQLREGLTDALELYLRWFDTLGRTEQQVRTDALRLLDNVAAWRSRYADEIAGVAAGAGIELWQAAALNGRTELIAAAPSTQPECSTLVRVPDSGAPYGIQTWDWHIELADCWHTQEVRGTRYAFAGITEHGILGKIGVNSAGLGLFFNILGHQDDSAAGIPVHVLAAAVLGEAGSAAEALDLLRTAPIRTSGAFTLLDPGTAVCAELSPTGATTLEPEAGFLVHTNHFLDPDAAAREKRGLFEPDSQLRHAMMTARVRDCPTPAHAVDLVAFLRSEPGEPKLCCVPDADASFGDRWATLATVLLEPAARTVRIHAGSPNTLTGWRTFVAAETVVAR
ncbi:C45 family autoproteolytic acyltransferase/hydolase [Amycolatopsis dendrobii]|uniref:Penicillin acyltransferase n=1 Tax=Amycolatopsis dendrobii TaxID=2760662 RepID=A0A7W3VXJ1_9PSEU|nr:C45 family peptidase [Amycolatopsis dendrobii]MBB1154876.1 penicillin acyltransferase [Amycolatopsis dendrobii]